MSEWIVEAQVVSASLSSDDWVKVLWRTKIEGKEEMLSSNFGPDFGHREKFYERTGVGPKNISSLEGKVFGARIYKSGRGKLQVSPGDLFDPNAKLTTKPATLTQPLGAMVGGKIPAPPPNASREEFKKATEAAKLNPMEELQKEVESATVVAEKLEQKLSTPTKTKTATKPNPQDPQVKRRDTIALKAVLKACDAFLGTADIHARMRDDKLFSLIEAVNTAVGMEIARRK